MYCPGRDNDFTKPDPEQIASQRDDRNGFCRLLKGVNCFLPSNYDDIDPCIDQFRRILRNQINVLPICAIFHREILAFNETEASQFVQKVRV